MSDKIALVCDSAANIPRYLLEKYNIDVVSLTTKIDGVEYKDIEMDCEEFYTLMKNSKDMPKTSQATYVDFIDVFQKHVSEGKTVLYISASSNVTGTYQSAVLAKKDVEGSVYIFDSLSLSLGCGLLVLEAAKMINSGKNIDEILERIEELRSNLLVLLTPNTLEYLYKGGRVSSGKMLAGSMLNIKPILGMNEGFIVPKMQVRGNKKAISTLVNTISNSSDSDFSDKVVGIAYGDNLEDFEKLKDLVEKELQPKEILVTKFNSCISSHTGPSTLGVAWFK